MEVIAWFCSIWKKLKCFRYNIIFPISIGILIYLFIKKELFSAKEFYISLINFLNLSSSWGILSSFCEIIFILLIIVICLIVWYYLFLRIPRFDKNKYGILIALSSKNPESFDALEDLYEKIVSSLDRYDCRNILEVKKARLDLIISRKDQADFCFKKSKAKMIVSSELFDENLDKDRTIHKFSNNIGFWLSEVNMVRMPTREEIFKEIPAPPLEFSNFGGLDNELKISDGISIRALILIANALRSYDEIEKAEKVLNDIIKINPKLKQIEVIRKNIALCKINRAYEIYEANGRYNCEDKILRKIDSILDSANYYYKERAEAYTLQALVNCLLGNISKTKKSINRSRLLPGDRFSDRINNCFMYVYDGQLKDAEINIQELFKDITIDESALDGCINFTKVILKKNNSRYHLYWYISTLYKYSKDYENALKYMEIFLKESQNVGDFNNINRAQDEIKNIKQQKEQEENVSTEKLSK